MKKFLFILSSNQKKNPVFKPVPMGVELLRGEGDPEKSPVFSAADLEQFSEFIQRHAGKYILGYIGYDFKNELFPFPAPNPPSLFPDLFLFSPEECTTYTETLPPEPGQDPVTPPVFLRADMNKATYIQKVKQIKEHIRAGDIYELNFCISFRAENVFSDPAVLWRRLQKISPMPFSAFFDHPDMAIISASPERFMKKKGNRLIIQPMKGTKKRSTDKREDKALAKALGKDEKERSENVMIVDLTRNDLSKIAERGSVQVDELFGVYSFPNIHQMISTVSCELKKNISFTEILQAVFPMGSMTGAPKLRAMQLINAFETGPRGPFSGMLGYIDPAGDFDFNVLIRTVFYHKKTHTLSISVGSAITAKSDPEKEYEECFIKLRPMLEALNASIIS